MANKPITHIVLHYSATARGKDIGVKEIDAMHKARGWKGVGYHYVIRLDGTIEKGRPETEVGAHVGGQNTGKIGICCIGGTEPGFPDVGVDTRTPAQTAAQIRLIKSILLRHPKAKVVGHRDLAATQCPGFDVIPWWEKVLKGPQVVASAPPSATGKPASAQKPVATPTQTSDTRKRAPAPPTAPAPAKPTGAIPAIFAVLAAIVAAAVAYFTKG